MLDWWWRWRWRWRRWRWFVVSAVAVSSSPPPQQAEEIGALLHEFAPQLESAPKAVSQRSPGEKRLPEQQKRPATRPKTPLARKPPPPQPVSAEAGAGIGVVAVSKPRPKTPNQRRRPAEDIGNDAGESVGDSASHKAVVQQRYLMRVPRKITLSVDKRAIRVSSEGKTIEVIAVPGPGGAAVSSSIVLTPPGPAETARPTGRQRGKEAERQSVLPAC